MAGSQGTRGGFTLPEMAMGLALAGFACAAAVGLLQSTQALARGQADGLARAEAMRIASAVLERETRFLDPERDVRGAGADSVALRAVRGLAVVCGAGDGVALVRYRGLRQPDPAKDSVLAVGPQETVTVLAGSRRVEEVCGGEDTGFRWELDPVPEPGTPLLLFESGSYHIANRAFRYRRGEAGRQPLTDERLDDRGVRFLLTDAAGDTAASGELAVLTVRLAGRRLWRPGSGDAPADTVRLRIPFLNAASVLVEAP